MALPRLITLVVVVLVTFSGVTSADEADKNKNIVEIFAEVINDGDLARLDDLVDPAVRVHSDAAGGNAPQNLEEFKAGVAQDRVAFPDGRQVINILLAENDMVALHVTFSGTNEVVMGPYQPTGRSVKLRFIVILRLKDGLWSTDVRWVGPYFGQSHDSVVEPFWDCRRRCRQVPGEELEILQGD